MRLAKISSHKIEPVPGNGVVAFQQGGRNWLPSIPSVVREPLRAGTFEN